MKLYLFGWAELGEAAAELKMIEKIIRDINPKQVLHIGFARTVTDEEERAGDRFHRNIQITDIEYLNAENPEDIAKAENPLIFISGGSEPQRLINKINADPWLLQLIYNASHIIGESSGAKILATYFRPGKRDPEQKMIPGLDIIKDTLIEGHYTQRNKQAALIQRMKETGINYGIGIDTCTAMVGDADNIMHIYTTIGKGSVYLKEINK